MYNVKAQGLGIRLLLALGMLLVMAIASVDTQARVSAHGGDASLVHLCVNDTNAQVRLVHPGPANADIDCVNPPWPLGAGWSPVDVGTISGVTAGTGLTGGGTTGPVTLDADTSFLQQRVSGTCPEGQSIREISATGTVTCEVDDGDGSSSVIFLQNNGSIVEGGRITYMGPDRANIIEANISAPFPRSGTVRGFRLKVGTTNINGPTVFTLRKNGADTSIQLTYPAGATGTQTDSDTVSFAAGDEFSIQVDAPGASAGYINDITVSFEY
jgi:hypothetical protein